MKKLFFFTMIVVQALTARSQELHTRYSDGLSYADTTTVRLTHIADSLNARFRQGAFNKQYYSVPEGIANSIHLTKGQLEPALNDIQQGISYTDFVRKYPAADTATNLLLTEIVEKRSATCNNVYYWLQGPDDIYPPLIYLTVSEPCDLYAHMDGPTGIKGNWVYNCTRLNPDGRGGLTAFYIVQAPEPKPITGEYAKMLGYADCLMDTTTEIYFPGAKTEEDVRVFSNIKPTTGVKEAAFIAWFQKDTAHLLRKYHMDVSKRALWPYRDRDSLLTLYIRDSLSSRPEFMPLLADAAQEALSTRAHTNSTFEYCVATFYSKSAALAMKRNRREDGSCGNSRGMETRMYEHDIAILASQTANWPVFLRARLHMMCDYFSRGNLADARGWVQKSVQVNELENLHIAVPDLLIGLSLCAGNPAEHHCSGIMGFLGQACAESTYRKDIEQKLLTMIKDDRLDNYNRLLMHFLFLKYAYLLRDKEERLACLQELEQADKTLPSCIAPRVKPDKKLFEQGIAGR